MQTLRTFTTMKVGGVAERILHLKDLKDLSGNLPEPIRILGNGSNTLIDDIGLKGTVIVVRDLAPLEPEIISEDENRVTLRVSAGMFLPGFCRWSTRKGFSGAEYMIGVPGTIGGALLQNAGANNQEFSDLLVRAHLISLKGSQFKSLALSKEECGLSYRHSKLKDRIDENLLVTSVELILLKGKTPEEIEAQVELNLNYRKQKTPFAKPSLGSIFKRIPKGENDWLYPGQLIEAAGLKKLRRGDAEVSELHANYIVNEGRATFDDMLGLIQEVERRVFEHSGQKLEREILLLTDRSSLELRAGFETTT